ncbi:UxaA family hydrolase [Candidatus Bipolaricaulota bacterium]|nr:UxaA family hydrolase [Candidatus Bipolaricaulota bacterium]
MSFQGFLRSDGKVGIRNVLLVLPAGQCANELALSCAIDIPTTFPLLHSQPCAHLGEDNTAAMNCLVGLGRNANAAAVLVVGIGCDSLSADDIASQIALTGKPVQCLTVEKCGSWEEVITQGRVWLSAQSNWIQQCSRTTVDDALLTLGVKCGGSDATSALAGNPAIGHVADRLIDQGGTVIFSETTELIGAEHLLMRRAATDQTKYQIQQAIDETAQRIRSTGVDPRGTQPTPGNIRGGLTTLEEKSLGGVLKTGTRLVMSVFGWGEAPTSPGLHMMDCPANVPQLVLGWAAAGVQLLIFSVGGGLPARIPSLIASNLGPFPLMPIIKILSNPHDRDLRDCFDVYCGTVLEGHETLEMAGSRIWERVISTASGAPTYLETYPAPAVHMWEMLVRGPTV